MTEEEPKPPESPVGSWETLKIPEGHYLKDGVLYWDPTSQAYRDMVSPKLTDGDPSVA